MKIFLGPFHPHLEKALAEEIQHIKEKNPLTPLLVLVPSDALKQHLTKLLTLDHQLNLLHFSIITFHQLSNMLYEEKYGENILPFQNEHFFEEMLRHLLHPTSTSTDYFSRFNDTDHGSEALWSTIRDLKDGLVDAYILLEALKEGHFEKRAIKNELPHLFTLYQQIKTLCQKNDIFDYGDLTVRASTIVKTSDTLKAFGRILYYGFYDLTQIQIDFFHEVTRHYPSTLFFPLIQKHPGWTFSERFFEQYVEGWVTDSSQIIDLTEKPASAQPFRHLDLFTETAPLNTEASLSCTIFNCYDKNDEILTVAKEIVRLVSDESVSFSEIGIVTRDSTPYQTAMKNIFSKHLIPITTPYEETLIQYPKVKSVFLMTKLLGDNFPRATVIELVTSPYFETTVFGTKKSTAQPYLWDGLTRNAKVTQGITAWERLRQYKPKGTPKPSDLKIIREQAQLLFEIVSILYQDLNQLPQSASWSFYAKQWQNLLVKTLGLPSDKMEEPLLTDEAQIHNSILDILQNLAELDRVADSVSHETFIQTLQKWLLKSGLLVKEGNHSGISVMNIMQARGIPFKFLFILGLNEGHFPRSIREDPFLQDTHRHVLESDLGFKIGEKLAGYDEERLLFTLLVGAAEKRIYPIYHRIDSMGKPASPSWYLDELRHVFTGVNEAKFNEITIPRGLIDRKSVTPFHRADLLLPFELAIRENLTSQQLNDTLLKQLPFSPELYKHGRKALMSQETKGPLTPYDGLIHNVTLDWKKICDKGISPTRLERYARCPYQFFSTQFLNLTPQEIPEEETQVLASDMGQLIHNILHLFYAGLLKSGYFSNPSKRRNVDHHFKLVSNEVFKMHEIENIIQYPLYWEEFKKQITTMLYEVIQMDLAHLSESGYRPKGFEVSCRQILEEDWPEMWGIIDRIDVQDETGQVRVIDYKTTLRQSPQALEKNLLTSALRGLRLQAPIYLRLADSDSKAGAKEEHQSESVFYHIAPNWPDGPLVISKFAQAYWLGETGEQLKKTITSLLKGIETGRFFMNPGDHCNYCDVRASCRLNHIPSWNRLQGDPLFEEHALMQKKKPTRPLKKGKAS